MIGYLVRTQFVCQNCFGETDVQPVSLRLENFGGYSQSCHICKKKIVTGTTEIEMFPNITEYDAAKLGQELLILKAAFEGKDWEVVNKQRRLIYENILKAVMGNTLRDREQVFKALDNLMKLQTPW
jgi:hypothetical protein